MSRKMWDGRFSKTTDRAVNDFNASIRFDSRMAGEDIRGSMAHAAMLAAVGVISSDDQARIQSGLGSILTDLENGTLNIDPEAEDIHMMIEAELTDRIGEAGKRLHTGRSRNDQVATDLKLWLRGAAAGL